MKHFLLLASLLAVSAISQTTPVRPGSTGPAQTPRTILGTNLAPPSYYGQERQFMNLVAGGGRQLISGAGRYGSVPDEYLNASNDVVQMSMKDRIVRAISAPTAAYRGEAVDIVCKWQGKTSRVEFFGPAVTKQKASLSAGTGSFTWKAGPVGSAGSVSFIYSGTKPDDPLRNLDCREAGADPTATFDPTFIADLRKYSVLRTMDWQSINNNSVRTWAERNKPGNGLYKAGDGIAYEHIVDLANLTGKDIWINVPWAYSAADVRSMATFFRDKLKPGIKVYLEVSNEVWNTRFPVTKQAGLEAVANGLATAANGDAVLARYSQRTGEVMTIWTQVFAGQANRLVRIAATQNNPYNISKILTFGTTAQVVDAIAIAPYFGGGIQMGILSTQAGIDDQLNVKLPAAIDTVFQIAALSKARAAKFGKRLIAYEGGQHVLSGDVAGLKTLERDPRMGALYTRYLGIWRSQFGDVFMHFTDVSPITNVSAFGAREYPGQPLAEAPKAAAIEAFVP